MEQILEDHSSFAYPIHIVQPDFRDDHDIPVIHECIYCYQWWAIGFDVVLRLIPLSKGIQSAGNGICFCDGMDPFSHGSGSDDNHLQNQWKMGVLQIGD